MKKGMTNYDVFLSTSRGDWGAAESLRARLKDGGFAVLVESLRRRPASVSVSVP
jgi:hypothetical protein